MRISDWSSDVCSSDLHRRLWGGELPWVSPPLQRRGSETWPGNAGLSRSGVVASGSAQGRFTTPNPSSEEEGLTMTASGRKPLFPFFRSCRAKSRHPSVSAGPRGISTSLDANGLVSSRVAPSRSEERRVGKGCVSTCRSRWWPYTLKKKKKKKISKK